MPDLITIARNIFVVSKEFQMTLPGCRSALGSPSSSPRCLLAPRAPARISCRIVTRAILSNLEDYDGPSRKEHGDGISWDKNALLVPTQVGGPTPCRSKPSRRTGLCDDARRPRRSSGSLFPCAAPARTARGRASVSAATARGLAESTIGTGPCCREGSPQSGAGPARVRGSGPASDATAPGSGGR